MPAFIDKYRYTSFDDIIGQEHIISYLKEVIKNPVRNPKSFIFNGPYGTGKTTTGRIFNNELDKKYKSIYYEFDVSIFNKESMKDIKDRIDNIFSYSPVYRVIVFDEIQNATKSAQSVLMKTIEDNIIHGKDRNIYFLFLTTDSSKIIEPIISRCVELNFSFIEKEKMFRYLSDISINENIKISDNDLYKLIYFSKGHMRDALKYLNIYQVEKEKTFELLFKINILIKKYLFDKDIDINDLDQIIIYSVNVLLNTLNIVIEEFIKNNIEKNYKLIIHFFELYMKYKNYITTLEDFISVIRILKKYILSYN